MDESYVRFFSLWNTLLKIIRVDICEACLINEINYYIHSLNMNVSHKTHQQTLFNELQCLYKPVYKTSPFHSQHKSTTETWLGN